MNYQKMKKMSDLLRRISLHLEVSYPLKYHFENLFKISLNKL
jgi:hypothetical protein